MQMTISAVLRYVTDSAAIYRVGNNIGISRMQDAAQFGDAAQFEKVNKFYKNKLQNVRYWAKGKFADKRQGAFQVDFLGFSLSREKSDA
ncbi:hypothetical protein CEXT_767351 [Caerostris extrusa]|uniref:Uncharacterized protein n=1 Tax=Caerostris extrusa TaxID=172846 RepID=A0AAV4VWF6_CAEEX|nr:hypothetical protein CEXT_767351 [Caerostris extrusa]